MYKKPVYPTTQDSGWEVETERPPGERTCPLDTRVLPLIAPRACSLAQRAARHAGTPSASPATSAGVDTPAPNSLEALRLGSERECPAPSPPPANGAGARHSRSEPSRRAPMGSFAGMSAPAPLAGDADGVPAWRAARSASEHARGLISGRTRVHASPAQDYLMRRIFRSRRILPARATAK